MGNFYFFTHVLIMWVKISARHLKFSFIAKVPDKSAHNVTEAIITMLKPLKSHLHTISSIMARSLPIIKPWQISAQSMFISPISVTPGNEG